MNGQFSGQPQQHAAYPPANGRPMMPGDGPIADFLQSLDINTQAQNTRQAASKNLATGASKLEHWTITKYDAPQIASPVWRISQRRNDRMSDSEIKAKVEKQRRLHRKALKLTSDEISPNQKRQIEDLVRHRNHFDLNAMCEWRVKALNQVKEDRKVKAVQVMLEHHKLNNPRQVSQPQHRWPDVHQVYDPKFQKQQEEANFRNGQNSSFQGQSRPDVVYGHMPSQAGQHHATGMPQQGQNVPQGGRLFGQVGQMADPRTNMANGAQGGGQTNGFKATDQQRGGAQSMPKSASSQMPNDGRPAQRPAAKQPPKIVQMTDSELSSEAEFSDWEDASHSGKSSAATEYTHHSRRSSKLQSVSSKGHGRKSHGRGDESSARKHSSKSSATSKKHSRHHQGDSSPSEDDSSSDDSFTDISRHSRSRKGRKHTTHKPEIHRSHRRPSPHGSSSQRSRRDSHVSAEVRPHRSSMSHKSPSHYPGYSVSSLSSSPKDTRSFPSSRYSGYGAQQLSQREWELEQKEARLEMQRRGMEEEMKAHQQRLTEQQLDMFFRHMNNRGSMGLRY